MMQFLRICTEFEQATSCVLQYIQRVRQDLERLRRQCNVLLRERHSLEQCIR